MHSTSTNLLKHFTDGLSGLDPSKNLQISRDDPNVNLKFLEGVKKEREEAKLGNLIDIGSCNLRVVHGAVKSVYEKTDWGLKSLIKGVFQLLKDSLSRPEDCISITGSSRFPL